MNNIDYYIGVVRELDQEFEKTIQMFDAIDLMVRPQWSLPGEFTAVVKDVMAIVDTAPSDAINSGAIALSGSTPIFSVMPMMANRMEYDRAQTLEDALGFNFKKSNRRGDGTIMYDLAESSLKYNTNCVRVDDLARILPTDPRTWNAMQKNAWRNGRFIYKVINPKRIRYMYSDMGLTLVAHKETMKVQDVINYWSLYENNNDDEGRRIQAELNRLRAAVGIAVGDKYKLAPNQLYFTQVYCIDYDRLMIWGSLTTQQGETIRLQDVTPDFIFADQKNPYGFLPWSIRVAGSRIENIREYRVNPLLAPLYWSGSWDKINLAKSIIFSEPIRRTREPRGLSKTHDGKPVRVDRQHGSTIALRTEEDYKPFAPITMDANALAVINALEAAMNRTTGASMIGDTTKISSDTPFATFSAMVKVALSRLDKQRENTAESCADLGYLDLCYVNLTDIPMTAYAESNRQMRSGTVRPRGYKSIVDRDDYDLAEIGLSCKVRPSTPTDEMEQINKAVILSKQLHQPVSEMLENMGYENIGLSYDLWTEEFLKDGELMARVEAVKAQYLHEVAMQAQAQQPPQLGGGGQGQSPDPMGAGGGIANTAFGGMGGGIGQNPAVGGMSPTMGAPGMTRETITGQDRLSQQR